MATNDKKVNPREITALVAEARRLRKADTVASDQEWAAYWERKRDLCDRIDATGGGEQR